jgi:hypothetical protein
MMVTVKSSLLDIDCIVRVPPLITTTTTTDIIKSPHHRQQHSTSNNNANTGNVGSISISGLPDSTKRIKYVLCENYIFAIYIIFFIIYLCWHFFLEMNACNIGMAFAMRCADIFICAGPFSFAFSIGTLMHQHGRL